MVTFLRAKDVGPDPIIAMRIILFFWSELSGWSSLA
jgi:hypothetical protein